MCVNQHSVSCLVLYFVHLTCLTMSGSGSLLPVPNQSPGSSQVIPQGFSPREVPGCHSFLQDSAPPSAIQAAMPASHVSPDPCVCGLHLPGDRQHLSDSQLRLILSLKQRTTPPAPSQGERPTLTSALPVPHTLECSHGEDQPALCAGVDEVGLGCRGEQENRFIRNHSIQWSYGVRLNKTGATTEVEKLPRSP